MAHLGHWVVLTHLKMVVYDKVKENMVQLDREMAYGVWRVALRGTFMTGAGWCWQGCVCEVGRLRVWKVTVKNPVYPCAHAVSHTRWGGRPPSPSQSTSYPWSCSSHGPHLIWDLTVCSQILRLSFWVAVVIVKAVGWGLVHTVHSVALILSYLLSSAQCSSVPRQGPSYHAWGCTVNSRLADPQASGWFFHLCLPISL